jgi:hypothetical protein
MLRVTFGVLHCFFVIAHNRRRILHFNVTRHSTSEWVAQQLREAFPCDSAPSYLIFDRATNFDDEVIETMKGLRHHTEANQLPQSMAEWSRRTMGWQLSKRLAGSSDRME